MSPMCVFTGKVLIAAIFLFLFYKFLFIWFSSSFSCINQLSMSVLNYNWFNLFLLTTKVKSIPFILIPLGHFLTLDNFL